jgi:hypothetical protein
MFFSHWTYCIRCWHEILQRAQRELPAPALGSVYQRAWTTAARIGVGWAANYSVVLTIPAELVVGDNPLRRFYPSEKELEELRERARQDDVHRGC